MTIFFAFIATLLCLVLAFYIKKCNNLNTTINKNKAEYEMHLKLLEKDLNKSKLLRHDYKKHLATLQGLIENGEQTQAANYIKDILKQNNKPGKITCGNAIVDSVINSKTFEIESSNIKFTIDANLPLRLDIAAPSITAILSNLLDNAIEAAQKCESGYINLKMKYTKGNFAIMIKNPYIGVINKNGDDFVTTKSDTLNHGFGLKTVLLTVKRLRGTCEIEHTNNIFSAFIVIPT